MSDPTMLGTSVPGHVCTANGNTGNRAANRANLSSNAGFSPSSVIGRSRTVGPYRCMGSLSTRTMRRTAVPA